MLLAKARGRSDLGGLQTKCRLRGPGWGFWILEISGWVLLENELALGIADPYPVGERHSQLISGIHVEDGLPEGV